LGESSGRGMLSPFRFSLIVDLSEEGVSFGDQ